MNKKQKQMQAHEKRVERLLKGLTSEMNGGRLSSEERTAAIGRVLSEMQGKQSETKRKQGQGFKMG